MPLITSSLSNSFRYGRPGDFTLSPITVIVEKILLTSCQNIVTLNAQVFGNIAGHTFYWEQTGGPPVIWLEPQNQLTVMYEKNPSQSGQDCFFRLYVDRYTEFEQVFDLIVSGIARDDPVLNITNNQNGLVSYPTTSTFGIFPYYTYSPNYTIDNSRIIITFGVPFLGNGAEYFKFVLYRVEDENLIQIQELSIDDRIFADPDPNKKYLIRYYFKVSGVYEDYYDSEVISINLNGYNDQFKLDTGDVFNAISSKNISGNVSVFQVNLTEISNLNNEENVILPIYNKSIGNISTYQIQLTTLEELPETPEELDIKLNTINKVAGTTSVFQVQVSDGITIIG